MNQAKNLGQYFTPDHVADFMIGLSQVPKSANILEPACGQGIFLKLLKEKGYKNLTGYEIDNTIKPITDVKIIFKSFISEKINGKYDLIIGNPPYIRWKNLDPELKNELENNDLWKRYFNSLCDYLYIFILKSVELLKNGGELIFITPEYWINTKHAENLRNYLARNGYFTDIIHFNETPIFNKVASSIIVFRFIKSDSILKKDSKIKVVKYLSSRRLSEDSLVKIKRGLPDKDIEIFNRHQFLPKKPWVLASSAVEKKLEAIEAKCTNTISNSLFKGPGRYFSLGDIADIGNGMVSGLDHAFQIPEQIELTDEEEKATISVLKAKNINQYLHGSITKYIFLNSGVKTESDLKEKYPNFHQLLSVFRDQLDKRYSYNRQINFWEWVFLRSFNLFNQEGGRIFVPCKERISHKNYFRFSYVSGGVFPTQDVTAIFLKPEVKESIYYVIALLNSDYVFEWLRHKGVVKGNIVEFSEKPLASIPIKRINWEDSREAKLHEEITSWCENYIANPSEETLKILDNKVATLFL